MHELRADGMIPLRRRYSPESKKSLATFWLATFPVGRIGAIESEFTRAVDEAGATLRAGTAR